MEIQTNGQGVFQMLPPGFMIFDRVAFDKAGKVETAFIIKDELKILNTIGTLPKIEIRSGIIENLNVLLLPLLMQFNINPDMIYECWFNFCNYETLATFIDLSFQKEIRIILVDENNSIHRILKIQNGAWVTFQNMFMTMKDHKRWTMNQFDFFKAETCREFPTSNDLWDKLGQDGEYIRIILD